MFFDKKDRNTLLVEVTDSEWNAFGDPTSFRAQYLYNILASMGGVNESVPPGIYHFNVKRRGFKRIISLLPAE